MKGYPTIVIPKRGVSREESAVSLPVASRFLAGKTGFGMTRERNDKKRN